MRPHHRDFRQASHVDSVKIVAMSNPPRRASGNPNFGISSTTNRRKTVANVNARNILRPMGDVMPRSLRFRVRMAPKSVPAETGGRGTINLGRGPRIADRQEQMPASGFDVPGLGCLENAHVRLVTTPSPSPLQDRGNWWTAALWPAPWIFPSRPPQGTSNPSDVVPASPDVHTDRHDPKSR